MPSKTRTLANSVNSYVKNVDPAYTGTMTGGALTLTGAASADTIKYKRSNQLATSTDLNTITDPGVYDVTGPVNGPGTGWWYVEVLTHSNGPTFCFQRATRLDSAINANNVYTRTLVGGVWTAWVKQALKSEVDANQTEVNTQLANKVDKATFTGANADFNTLWSNNSGLYTLDKGGMSNSNSPDGGLNHRVVQIGNSGRGTQITHGYATPEKLYFRNASDGSFSPWYEVVTTYSLTDKLEKNGDGSNLQVGNLGNLYDVITKPPIIKYTASTLNALGDIVLSNAESVDGKNGRAITNVGSECLFKLKNYAPTVENLYISDNSNATKAAFLIDSSRFARISHIKMPNIGKGIAEIKNTTGTAIAIVQLEDIQGEGCTGTAFSIGSSVSNINATNVGVLGQLDYVNGYGKPRAGAVGWRQNTPVVNDIAVGGHQITNCKMESLEKGWWLTDAQLTLFTNIIADSCRDYGFILDGDCDHIDVWSLFVGTSRGLYVGGTSRNIHIRNLTTIFTGVIPPWGSADFFTSSGPFYDVTVAGTAKVTIDGNSWRGSKQVSVAPTAELTVTGGITKSFRTKVTNTGSFFVDLFGNQKTLESDCFYRVPNSGVLFFARSDSNYAPGSGQSYTITLRIDTVSTGLVTSITGSANSFSKMYKAIPVREGQVVSVQLDVSSSANIGTDRYLDFSFQILTGD